MLFRNLKRGVAPSPLMNVLRQRTSMYHMPFACFAGKYDRNKPHLNVGTIGKLNHLLNLIVLICIFNRTY